MNRLSFLKSIGMLVAAPAIVPEVAKGLHVDKSKEWALGIWKTWKEMGAVVNSHNYIRGTILCEGKPLDLNFMEEIFIEHDKKRKEIS